MTEKKNDFPAARWILFKYPRQALEALAFGNLDFYLGSQATVHYLINLENLQELDIQIRNNAPPHTFSFAATREQRTWITIIDKLMARIPQATHLDILQRWSGSLRHREPPALLNSLEKNWLSQNQRILSFLKITFRSAILIAAVS